MTSFELIALLPDRDESIGIFQNKGNAHMAMDAMKHWYPGMRVQELKKKYPNLHKEVV